MDLKTIRPKLKTKPGTVYFWTGRTKLGDKYYSGPENALAIAKARGGTTLEGTLADQGIEMPEWSAFKIVQKAWDDVSGAFAEQTQGPAHVVRGQELRPGNVWETTEWPRLANMPSITKITAVDPGTQAESVIFARP